jgi:hypothetical protein
LLKREGLVPPVTGTPGVVVISVVGASVAAPVGASVAALVLVDSTVTGGTFVLGTLVLVCCPPQAASNKAARISVVENILNLLILTNLLFFRSFTNKIFFPLSIFRFGS